MRTIRYTAVQFIFQYVLFDSGLLAIADLFSLPYSFSPPLSHIDKSSFWVTLWDTLILSSLIHSDSHLRWFFFGSENTTNCSVLPALAVLWPLLTSCSSLLLRIAPSARPPEVRHLTFLVYSLNLLHKVTHIFLDFSLFSSLILLYSLDIKFLFIKPRFCYTLPPLLASRRIACASLMVGRYVPP